MTNFSEATSYANQLIAKYGDEREGLSRMLDRFEAHMNEGWGDAEADVIATALRAFLFPVTPARNLEALTAQKQASGVYRVAYDGRILGDSRGFRTEALCLVEIARILAKDARDAVTYARPLLYRAGLKRR